MKFTRLPDYLLTVLFEDDDIIAVDKPYGFNSHTNDSKIDHSDFIQDGLIEIFEKQRRQKLHIIHRLDQTTTGVIIFGKSQDSAKKYAEYFFNRQVKKTYLFITASKSKADSFFIEDAIVHKGRELEAKTRFTFLTKSARHELWQANPHTGRNHQIRIHAKAAGISILGDPTYGGADFHFLCLHNHRIEFPNGIVIMSEVPRYFSDLPYLEDKVLAQALFQMDRRQRLFGMVREDSESPVQHQIFRLVEPGASGGDLDFALDHFGGRLALSSSKELNEPATRRYLKLSGLLGRPILVRTPSRQVLLSSATEASLPPVWQAREDTRIFDFQTNSNLVFNFTVSQRLQRTWVQQNARGKRVLNLFAGTGGFALAAAQGGAAEVAAIELSKAALGAGKALFSLNAVEPQTCKFLLRDSLVFLKQALNKESKFDIIICEAPSFFRGEKKVFKIDEDLENLVADCLSRLADEGTLLLSSSSDKLTINDVRGTISKVLKRLKTPPREIEYLQPSFDFALPNEGATLKSFLVTPLTLR